MGYESLAFAVNKVQGVQAKPTVICAHQSISQAPNSVQNSAYQKRPFYGQKNFKYKTWSKSEQEAMWRDLFSRPHDWWDARQEKQTRRSPDFVSYTSALSPLMGPCSAVTQVRLNGPCDFCRSTGRTHKRPCGSTFLALTSSSQRSSSSCRAWTAERR